MGALRGRVLAACAAVGCITCAVTSFARSKTSTSQKGNTSVVGIYGSFIYY
ncbi:hypothetical protein PR003_g18780 [Phytophthora rubi]|uniref:Uncharacterized protein n=1 Tax=Phytophthora rubi TaxID=129364 RepID=A0A6A4DY00_9STRA|nr:hypothetical protein PR003_g18780 [Phytophthora rubi]